MTIIVNQSQDMDQLEAYPFYSEDYINHPQRALGNPIQGQSMRRDLSSGSYSSNGTYSSISPTSPVTPASMSAYFNYNTTVGDQYADCGEYNDEEYYLENDVVPPSYYEPPQDANYLLYTSQEPMEATYGDDFQQIPMMPPPMPDNEVSSGLHFCIEPGCESMIGFKRKADLQRHYDQLHRPDSHKLKLFCNYEKCDRSRDPFHRMDHFRDHYRDFHNEDLPRKGGEKPEWYKRKAETVSKKWWRCVKCLTKVVIKSHGFQCVSCSSTCDMARRKIRGQ